MTENIQVMYTKEEVDNRIQQLAVEINTAYGERSLHLICILKGSVFFCCELAKHLTMPVTLDFMSVSSYGESTVSSGDVNIKKDLDESIRGLDCLLIEDIVDTGNTLSKLEPILLEREPASLRICTLLDKPSRRETELTVDFTGFQIPDKFVVGYGLDYAQRYRNLPYIGELEFVD